MEHSLDPFEVASGVITGWAKYFLNTIDSKHSGKTSSLNGDWGDSRNQDIEGKNCILDSEILLVFLLAELNLKEFQYKPWDGVRDKQGFEQSSFYKPFFEADSSVKVSTGWDKKIKRALVLYFERNSDNQDNPTFSSDTYLDVLDPEYKSFEHVETVDGYSYSLTTSLYIRILAERLKSVYDGFNDVSEVEFWSELSAKAEKRITAALVGMLSSFSIVSMDKGEWEAATDRIWPNTGGYDGNSASRIDKVKEDLEAIGYVIPKRKAFEVGWSWGPVEEQGKSANFEQVSGKISNLNTFSENAPYLYFTLNALDGISDLSDTKIESGGLLSPEQLSLAAHLKTLASITAEYWLVLATSERNIEEWEIEVLPWLTADSQGSFYWSLFLSRLIVSNSELEEADLIRFTNIVERLAEVGRITSPPYPREGDPALNYIHYPGLQIELFVKGSETPVWGWVSYDFSAQLLKLIAQLSSKSNEPSTRQRLAKLKNRVWVHLRSRLGDGEGAHWDKFWNPYPNFFSKDEKNKQIVEQQKKAVGYNQSKPGVNSWYMTERVQEALVMAAQAERISPRPSAELQRISLGMVHEAQWLMANPENKMDDALLTKLRFELENAREKVQRNPGDAIAQVVDIFNTIRQKR